MMKLFKQQNGRVCCIFVVVSIPRRAPMLTHRLQFKIYSIHATARRPESVNAVNPRPNGDRNTPQVHPLQPLDHVVHLPMVVPPLTSSWKCLNRRHRRLMNMGEGHQEEEDRHCCRPTSHRLHMLFVMATGRSCTRHIQRRVTHPNHLQPPPLLPHPSSALLHACAHWRT